MKNIDITVKIVPGAKKKYSVEVQKSEESRSILSFIDDSEFVAILDDKGDSFMVPWELFRATGDAGLLERQYDSARAWVDLVD